MAEQVVVNPRKPSFFSSVISGIGGTLKGILTGAGIGILVGGAIAAAVGYFAPETGAQILKATLGGSLTETIMKTVTHPALLGAIGGAAAGGAALGAVGGISGTVTGVVKSREAASPSASDVTDLAKISFTQGVALGHQVGIAEAQEQGTSFRDKVARERAQQPTQRVH